MRNLKKKKKKRERLPRNYGILFDRDLSQSVRRPRRLRRNIQKKKKKKQGHEYVENQNIKKNNLN